MLNAQAKLSAQVVAFNSVPELPWMHAEKMEAMLFLMVGSAKSAQKAGRLRKLMFFCDAVPKVREFIKDHRKFSGSFFLVTIKAFPMIWKGF